MSHTPSNDGNAALLTSIWHHQVPLFFFFFPVKANSWVSDSLQWAPVMHRTHSSSLWNQNNNGRDFGPRAHHTFREARTPGSPLLLFAGCNLFLVSERAYMHASPPSQLIFLQFFFFFFSKGVFFLASTIDRSLNDSFNATCQFPPPQD